MHLGRHSVLLTAKIDQAIAPLMAAAPMPGRNHALIVATAESLLGHAKRAGQTGARSELGEVAHAGPTASRRSRFVTANTHGFCSGTTSWAFRNHLLVQKKSIRCSGFSLTMAFFQGCVLPIRNRLRRGFPLRFWMWTRRTLTLNKSSTALRTSCFVAKRFT